jgi:putative tryptophan/tyrosine transport system substrate-binding protein
MRRRNLLTAFSCAAMAAPLRARAQQKAMPVIGFLSSESPPLFASRLDFFRQGLGETGYVEGKNVVIEYRWAEGRNDRLPALAADLVRRQVDVIAAPGTTPAAIAAKQATTTIPIVIFTAGDPVSLGLVASLNRPGGNVTGVASLGGELAAKRLSLLHELIPSATVMALLVNPTNPALVQSTAEEVQVAARTLGLQLHIARASTDRDFDAAFATMHELKAAALVIAVDSFFTARRIQLAELALRYRVPAIYQYRDFAAAAGVMSYGGGLEDPYRLVGRYTGRILKGEKASDLPVQQATRIELVLNLKTAKALGLKVPRPLLALADEVIE